VVPLVLDAGRPLFASGLPELPLRLLEAKSFPSGLAQLRYARTPPDDARTQQASSSAKGI